MDVSDVLRDRRQTSWSGLERMVFVSAVAHSLLVVGMLLAPGTWLHDTQESAEVMHISLGGGSGPSSGGTSALAARPVQTTEPATRPEPVRPPAASAPKMTVPTDAPQRRAREATPDRPTPPEARGTTPTRGTEVSTGQSVAETGARGQGFGLSSGGGAGGATLDVGNFCCPEYISAMVVRIRDGWSDRADRAATTDIHFTIQRDGKITDATVARTSGDFTLDQAALRAVVTTQTLPPLPPDYPNPTLGVRLSFIYSRS
jgi:periplasmic protein TonB